MTLKGKFTLLSAVLVVFVTLAAGQNHFILQGLINDVTAGDRAAEMLRRHMHADMLHDALRAEVLRTLLAVPVGDRKAMDDASAKARDMAAALNEDFAELQRMNLPPDTQVLLKTLSTEVAGYTAAGLTLTETAKRDMAANTKESAGMTEDFNRRFDSIAVKADELSGMLEKNLDDLSAQQNKALGGADTRSAVVALVTVLAALFLPLYSRFRIFRPQERLIGSMEDISAGKLAEKIPYLKRQDEIGAIARAVKGFQHNAAEKLRLEAESRNTKAGLADNFEANVKSVADTVASAATEMDATSRDVMKRAQDSSEKLGALVKGINGASQNVQTVSAAAEELSASVREIGRQVENGHRIMTSAVAEAESANAQAGHLNEAAERIGSVIDVINEITSQINMLALNATIEAARAGEQGKGFAVVAFEIKDLASQTTTATREVEKQISFIQNSAEVTVGVLQRISATIGQMNQISSAIAAAVEEQGVATQEIARNVRQAAETTAMVSTNATDVKETSIGASAAVSQMIAAASDLSRQSESLRGQVGTFLRDIKTA